MAYKEYRVEKDNGCLSISPAFHVAHCRCWKVSLRIPGLLFSSSLTMSCTDPLGAVPHVLCPPHSPQVGGRKVWGGHEPLSLHSTAARHTPGLHAVPLQWTVGTSAMQTEQCNHIVLCCAAQCRGAEHAALPAPADRKGENGTAPLCSVG